MTARIQEAVDALARIRADHADRGDMIEAHDLDHVIALLTSPDPDTRLSFDEAEAAGVDGTLRTFDDHLESDYDERNGDV